MQTTHNQTDPHDAAYSLLKAIIYFWFEFIINWLFHHAPNQLDIIWIVFFYLDYFNGSTHFPLQQVSIE